MSADTFWNIVKREVDRQHTSFEWLYRKTGIPKGTFSSWKNRNTIPRADHAYKIACALGVTVAYLLTGADTPQTVSRPLTREIAEVLAGFCDADLEAVAALVREIGRQRKKKRPAALS
jgi:transcriptional regulator with XRE-family HTH domain